MRTTSSLEEVVAGRLPADVVEAALQILLHRLTSEVQGDLLGVVFRLAVGRLLPKTVGRRRGRQDGDPAGRTRETLYRRLRRSR